MQIAWILPAIAACTVTAELGDAPTPAGLQVFANIGTLVTITLDADAAPIVIDRRGAVSFTSTAGDHVLSVEHPGGDAVRTLPIHLGPGFNHAIVFGPELAHAVHHDAAHPGAGVLARVVNTLDAARPVDVVVCSRGGDATAEPGRPVKPDAKRADWRETHHEAEIGRPVKSGPAAKRTDRRGAQGYEPAGLSAPEACVVAAVALAHGATWQAVVSVDARVHVRPAGTPQSLDFDFQFSPGWWYGHADPDTGLRATTGTLYPLAWRADPDCVGEHGRDAGGCGEAFETHDNAIGSKP
jgi:hypothetical protein